MFIGMQINLMNSVLLYAKEYTNTSTVIIYWLPESQHGYSEVHFQYLRLYLFEYISYIQMLRFLNMLVYAFKWNGTTVTTYPLECKQ